MRSWSRFEKSTFLLTLIGCAAAVFVVPEFRCVVGLSVEDGVCSWRRGSPDAPFSNWVPVSAPSGFMGGASLADAADEIVVGRIRRTFEYVESHLAGLSTWRKELRGAGLEDDYANIWSEEGAIRKIRVRFHQDGVRTSLQFYYTGGELVFVYAVVNRIGANGSETNIDQNRFYFDDGRLVRWLDGNRVSIPSDRREFRENERRLNALGRTLLRGAREAGPAIRL